MHLLWQICIKVGLSGFFACMAMNLEAQDRYLSKTGHVYFLSHTDIIDIEGYNTQANAIFDMKTGEIAVIVLIKAFEFTLATAEEHFNETYMESHVFPKAKFNGKIFGYPFANNGFDGVNQVKVTGELTIHGVTRSVTADALLEKKGEDLKGTCRFRVRLEDYAIKVPKVVEDRVAEEIEVKIDILFRPFVN